MVSNMLIERREAHSPALLSALLVQPVAACVEKPGALAYPTESLLAVEELPGVVVIDRLERRLAPIGTDVQGTSLSRARRRGFESVAVQQQGTGVFGTRVAAGSAVAPAHNYKSIVLAQDPRGSKGGTGGVPPRRKPDEG